MRSILAKVGLFLTLLEVVLASTLEPRRNKSPILPDSFNCGDVVFDGKFLKGVVDDVKRKYKYRLFNPRELSHFYDGPPFTKPHLAWPISLKTKSYKKAMLGPYQAIIRGNFEIFSIIAERTNGIQECELIEQVAEKHQEFNYKCGTEHFAFNYLIPIVKTACYNIHKIASQKFPARYEGSHFSESGKQRYIYPIKASESFSLANDPGPFRVVLNSACRLVGAITVYNNGKIYPCLGIPANE